MTTSLQGGHVYFEHACRIDCPRDEVYARLEVTEEQPRERWSMLPGVEDGPAEREPRDEREPHNQWLWLPLPSRVETILVEAQPPQRLLFEWESPGMRGQLEYRLMPSGRGTRVELRTSLEIQDAPALLHRAVRHAFHRATERRLARLRRSLESDRVGPPCISWPPDPAWNELDGT